MCLFFFSLLFFLRMSSFMIGTIFECAFNKFGLFLLQNGFMVRGDTKVVDAIKAQDIVQNIPPFVPPVVGVSAAMSQVYLAPPSPREPEQRGQSLLQQRLAETTVIPPNELRVFVYDRDKPFIYENCFDGKWVHTHHQQLHTVLKHLTLTFLFLFFKTLRLPLYMRIFSGCYKKKHRPHGRLQEGRHK